MKQPKRLWRFLLFFFLFAALCGSFAFPVVSVPVNAAPRMQAATDVVISEFRFRGSGGGNDEFVEIFNPTAAQVNLNGWKLNGSNNSGGTGTRYTFSTDVLLQPGQHYLLANNANVDGIAADATYGTGITADGGVALLRPDNSIVDAVGLSAGSAYKEGTVLQSLGSDVDQSYERNADGLGICIDTNNNAADFFLRNPSDPQNSTSPVILCGNPTATPVPPTATATGAAPLSVIINEVAWSGTAASNQDEWFELYNNTGAPINLAGWSLQADDGNPNVALSGTINPGDYFVVARFAVVFNDLTPDLTYSSGSFSNDGEVLFLLDPNGNQVDTANLDGGAWNAGLGSPTFASMERQGAVADSPTAWITYGGTVPVAHDRGGNAVKGTPGQGNWITTVTITPSPTITNTPTRTSTPGLCGVGVAPTSIIISEVAWAGTAAPNGSSDEWIELYNPTANTINLNGWILKGLDGSPNIILPNYDLGAGQFYVLERGDDTTISDVNAHQIFTGELANTNEVLQLYNFLGVCVDTANSNGGNWPAGNATTFNSMERRGVVSDSDIAWITNVQANTWLKHDARGTSSSNFLIRGTPGYANWAFSVTPTASPFRTATPHPTATRTLTPPPPPPLVAINEFVPRPGHDWNNDGIVNYGDEYIELLNHGVVNVDLSGYSLDDEVNIGSAPYRLPAMTLRPGERVVFYGSQTGLLLSDGGDGVRLLRPNGQLMDAYNYFVVRYPDQAYCRLPDNGGADDWNQNCFPTPGLQNSLSGGAPRPEVQVPEELFCPIADTLPTAFAQAECDPYGNNIWRAEYWDRTGWYGEKYLPGLDGKWPVFAD